MVSIFFLGRINQRLPRHRGRQRGTIGSKHERRVRFNGSLDFLGITYFTTLGRLRMSTFNSFLKPPSIGEIYHHHHFNFNHKVICIMPRSRPRAAQMVATLMHDQVAKEGYSTLKRHHGESSPTPKQSSSPELRHLGRCVCVHACESVSRW